MKKEIITISREFGSGGRTIAKLLAEKMGYAYYDREIIYRLAEQSGLHRKYIEEQGEYAPGNSSLIYSLLMRDRQGLTMNDTLWTLQSKLIREYAETGHCVMVGRCADFILKDRSDVLNVFVHADMEFRKKRIVEEYGERADAPEKRISDKDKRRAVHYKYYTGQNWGEAKNYHIALDSGCFGIDRCVKMLCDLAEG